MATTQALTIAADQLGQDRIDLLKRTICKGSTNDELQLFIAQCKRTGLDPFAKQIYAVKRWDKNEGRDVVNFQTSIDGFRLIAERTGEYRGQTPPMWCGEDGTWKDVWLSNDPPAAAKVGVHRESFKDPIYAVARYGAYVQLAKDKASGKQYPTQFWAKMPDLMLAKCAESLALRKAFPQELSGLYTADEMPEERGSHEAQQEVAAQKIAAMKAEAVVDVHVMEPKALPPAPPIEDKPIKVEPKPFDFKEMMNGFAEIKKKLAEFGAEQIYYNVLSDNGMKHSNEIRDAKAARKIYKQMADEYKRLKAEREEEKGAE
jgi:phage recombination protein Bet